MTKTAGIHHPFFQLKSSIQTKITFLLYRRGGAGPFLFDLLYTARMLVERKACGGVIHCRSADRLQFIPF